MLTLIADLSSAQSSGFVPLLKALSHSAGGGAWLTRIEFADPQPAAAPSRVRLSGRMTAAAALPRYLDAMARHTAFAGRPSTRSEVAAGAGQLDAHTAHGSPAPQIGRASCRERTGQYGH